MRLLKSTWINLLQWRNDSKYLTVVAYMVMNMWFSLRGICDYAIELDARIHPWIFPFLMRGGGTICPLMLGYTILIADAPFRNCQQQFILLRTGKAMWLGGQILYLFLLSTAFTLLLYLLSIVFIFPRMQPSLEWGSFLTTIAVTGLPGKYGSMSAQYSVMKGASPLETTLWTVTVLIFVCFLLGMIMLLCNLWVGKGMGLVIVSCFVILPQLTFSFQSKPYIYRYITWISPLNWIDRSILGHTGQNLPSYTYAFIMPIVLSFILIVVAMFTIHRCNLETGKE